jgi:steroid delta-isomerase-like uncharacterized protein
MSSGYNAGLVRCFYEEILNRGNLAVADELLAEEYVWHHASGADIPGREGLRQLMGAVRKAFPDFHCTIHDIIAAGDKVVVRFTMTGTHQGEYSGMAPTGKEISVGGITIGRIAGGKLVETWERYDTLGLWQQLSGTGK